jgi:hypothetical protein
MMLERAKEAAWAIAFQALFGFLAFQIGVASKYPQRRGQDHASAERQEQKNTFDRFWDWTTHDAVAVYTLVLAFSTIGLWSVTGRGVKTQIADTRILQRAYISVEPRGIRLRVDSSSIMGHVAIRNAGNLPARNVSWFINIKWSPNGEEEVFPLSSGKGSVVITPGTEAMRGSGGSLLLQDLLNGCKASEFSEIHNQAPVYIYVWGIIAYDDGFGASRVTKFCHRYNWMMRDSFKSIDVRHARLHEFGNDST